MKIAICGSLTFEKKMHAVKADLESAGYEVFVPFTKDGADVEPAIRKKLIDDYFGKIDMCDAIMVVNETKNGIDGYIGGNVLMEMAYAYAQGLEIFVLNNVPAMSYEIELKALDPILLNGDITKINDYFNALPLVYMSTVSPVKHTAVSRAFRKAGVRVRLDGTKVESGVNEQPLSIDETYDGALHRHAQLKPLAPKNAAYLATIESGQHVAHKNHSMFGCAVIMLEKVGEQPKIGIDLDVEFPQAMLDKVPSKYPDLGVLVQKEYGATLKDPYPYFTNNKLTRARMLENAVYNVAVQL